MQKIIILLLLLGILFCTTGSDYLGKVSCPILIVTDAKDNVRNYELHYVTCKLLGEYDGEGSLDCTEAFDKMNLSDELNPRIRHGEPLAQCKRLK